MKAIILAGGAGRVFATLTATIRRCLVPIGRQCPCWSSGCGNASVPACEAVLINTHHMAEARCGNSPAAAPGLAHPTGLRADPAWKRWNHCGELELCRWRRIFFWWCMPTISPPFRWPSYGVPCPARADCFGGPFRSPNPSACGVVELREDGLITGFWEKAGASAGQPVQCRLIRLSPRSPLVFARRFRRCRRRR